MSRRRADWRSRIPISVVGALCALPLGAASYSVGPVAQQCTHETLAEAVAAAHANGPESDFIDLLSGQTYPVAGPLAIDLEVSGDIQILGRLASCFGLSNPAPAIVSISSGSGFVVDAGASPHALTFQQLRIEAAPEASGVGRMLEASGNVLIRAIDAHFRGGTAFDGGVLRIGAGATLESLVQEVTVEGGEASGDGGGILIDGGTLRPTNGLAVRDNLAHGRGGGIACRNGGALEGNSLYVHDNHADQAGGGLSFDGCDAVFGGLVAGNETSPGGVGGGLDARGGSTVTLAGLLFDPFFPDVTPSFVGNSAGLGGALFVSGAGTTIEVRQTQLLDNSADEGGAVAVGPGGQLRIAEAWITGNAAAVGSAAAVSSGSLTLEAVFLSGQSGGSLAAVDGAGALTAALVTAVANDLAGAPTFSVEGAGSSIELATSAVLDGRVFGPPASGVAVDADCVAALDLTDFPLEPRPGAYLLAAAAGDVVAHPDGSSPALHPESAAVDFCDGAPWLPATLDIDGEARVYDAPPAGSSSFGVLDLGADESRGVFFADHEEGDCSDWNGVPACP